MGADLTTTANDFGRGNGGRPLLGETRRFHDSPPEVWGGDEQSKFDANLSSLGR